MEETSKPPKAEDEGRLNRLTPTHPTEEDEASITGNCIKFIVGPISNINLKEEERISIVSPHLRIPITLLCSRVQHLLLVPMTTTSTATCPIAFDGSERGHPWPACTRAARQAFSYKSPPPAPLPAPQTHMNTKNHKGGSIDQLITRFLSQLASPF